MSAADPKKRIISHMNADHHDSITRYAEFYAKTSRFASRNAHLTDISLDKLIITTGGSQRHTIPLDPPMSNLREARERLVDMDKQAIAGLDRSPITLKEYRRPRSYAIIVFALCLGTYLLLSRRENMMPGSLPYELLLKHVPRFAAFALRVRDLVLWPMIAIHVMETYFMTRTLEKHSVPLFSGLWWTWCISCYIEGFNSFQRIAAIEQEQMEKGSKH